MSVQLPSEVHKNQNVILVLISLFVAIISIIRFGMSIHIGNDNEFIIYVLLNDYPNIKLALDPILMSGYSEKTIFFTVFKSFYQMVGVLPATYTVFFCTTITWIYVWQKIYLYANVSNPFAYIAFLFLISSPYIFDYSAPPLYDAYPSPRFMAFLLLAISLLVFLQKKEFIACSILGISFLFHIPTALPAAVLFVVHKALNSNRITLRHLCCLGLIGLPLITYLAAKGNQLTDSFNLFLASPDWLYEVKERIPYIFFENFDLNQTVTYIGWYLVLPTTLLLLNKDILGKISKNLTVLSLLPVSYGLVGQISIDLLELPIAMVANTVNYTKIYLIPIFLLTLQALQRRGLPTAAWLIILIFLIYRVEYLSYFLAVILVDGWFSDNTRKYGKYKIDHLRKVPIALIIVLAISSAFLFKSPMNNLNLKNYFHFIATGWAHPHYGLRIEPLIWRTNLFFDKTNYWQSPSFSRQRLEILTYIKYNTESDELTMISETDSEEFADFRTRTNRGLLWDNKSGGALYYNGQSFLEFWKENRDYNMQLFKMLEYSVSPICTQVNSGFLDALQKKNVKWVLTTFEAKCKADFLDVVQNGPLYFLYEVRYSETRS